MLPKHSHYPLSEETYQLEGYNLILSGTNLRGVAVYTRNNLLTEKVTFGDAKEYCACSIKLKEKDKLLICNVYRSPNSCQDNNKQLLQLLRNIHQQNYSHILITGDFNYKEINWGTNSTGANENHPASIFLECVRDCYMYQHVTNPTRYREGQEPSILDLIFTNEENAIANVDIGPGLGKSDHLFLTFDLICYTERISSNIKKRNFHKGDYESISQELEQINWDTMEEMDNIDEVWSYLTVHLSNIIERHIPESKVNPYNTSKKTYIDKTALAAIKKKHQLWKKYVHCKENTGCL